MEVSCLLTKRIVTHQSTTAEASLPWSVLPTQHMLPNVTWQPQPSPLLSLQTVKCNFGPVWVDGSILASGASILFTSESKHTELGFNKYLKVDFTSLGSFLLNIHSFHRLLPLVSVALAHAYLRLLVVPWPLSLTNKQELSQRKSLSHPMYVPGPLITSYLYLSCLLPL